MSGFWAEAWAVISGGAAAQRAAFEQQLPHALELLGDELIVGRSLVDALDRAAESLDEPARGAFQRLYVASAARGGTESLAGLLASLGSELRSPLLQEVAATVAILEPLGGDLSKILYGIAEHVRRAREVGQRVQDAQWVRRRDAYGVLGMAVALVALLALIPSMRTLVFGSAAGRASFALGLALILVSMTLIWNVVRGQPEIDTGEGVPARRAPRGEGVFVGPHGRDVEPLRRGAPTGAGVLAGPAPAGRDGREAPPPAEPAPEPAPGREQWVPGSS